jgi:hypothetical protein
LLWARPKRSELFIQVVTMLIICIDIRQHIVGEYFDLLILFVYLGDGLVCSGFWWG